MQTRADLYKLVYPLLCFCDTIGEQLGHVGSNETSLLLVVTLVLAQLEKRILQIVHTHGDITAKMAEW